MPRVFSKSPGFYWLPFSFFRALREIELLKKDVLTLGKQVKQFEQKLSQVCRLFITLIFSQLESDSQDAVFFIDHLDNIKSKMENCKNIINEAQKYTKMAKEIETVFEKQEDEKVFLFIF